ncbi:hypothetical protein ACNJ7E_14905 [Rhodococcus sp. NM-2]|uniref:hypothetical protein n=1 Tax=Rhodococcus sp. NM-2 TaxID=3401174 RepID=UPI003AAE9EB3
MTLTLKPWLRRVMFWIFLVVVVGCLVRAALIRASQKWGFDAVLGGLGEFATSAGFGGTMALLAAGVAYMGVRRNSRDSHAIANDDRDQRDRAAKDDRDQRDRAAKDDRDQRDRAAKDDRDQRDAIGYRAMWWEQASWAIKLVTEGDDSYKRTLGLKALDVLLDSQFLPPDAVDLIVRITEASTELAVSEGDS